MNRHQGSHGNIGHSYWTVTQLLTEISCSNIMFKGTFSRIQWNIQSNGSFVYGNSWRVQFILMEHLFNVIIELLFRFSWKGLPGSSGTVHWYSNGTFTQILKEPLLRIPMQPSLKSALGFSWSLHLEPTTFRYRRKPSAICSVHHVAEYVSPTHLPHHSKPHSNRTAENKEAILINLIIVYLFILV